MLIEFAFDLFFQLADFFINLIPDLEVSSNLISYLNPVAEFVGYLDTFVSLPLIITCMTFLFAVDNWNLISRILIKLWELIPFV